MTTAGGGVPDPLFEQIQGGRFEADVRARLGLDGTWRIDTDVDGGQTVMIGEYTGDTDTYTFTICAQRQTIGNLYGQRRLVSDPDHPSVTRTFHDMPDIWEWLAETPDPTWAPATAPEPPATPKRRAAPVMSKDYVPRRGKIRLSALGLD